MNDELNIPVLDDLVSKGQVNEHSNDNPLSFDENSTLEIEEDPPSSEPEDTVDSQQITDSDELSGDASLQELLIDEEIRMILDKHMDRAYEEIIRLLNHKIS
ncbi:MAG: hypothetical protein QNJ56_02205 [Gammaproteobacteria bacterium]|nr:hypothetical protein [Gammaproteobacteria bacterium]